jgi:diguanylate cyclase (GGDEF)-like protein
MLIFETLFISVLIYFTISVRSCQAQKQLTSETIFLDAGNNLLEHLPVGVFVIDNQYQIKHTFFRQRKSSELMKPRFLGKSILKTSSYLLAEQEQERFWTALSNSVEFAIPSEIPSVKIATWSGFPEYFKVKITPAKDGLLTYILFQNVTDTVLLQEEFVRVSEEFATANQELSAALSNLDLYIMDRERVHNDLAALHHIITKIQAGLTSLDDTLTRIIQAIVQEVGYSKVALLLTNEIHGNLEIKAQTGLPHISSLSLPEKSIQSGSAVYVPDNCKQSTSLEKAALPLTVHNRVIGSLYIESCIQRQVMRQDLDLLHAIASHTAMVIDHVKHDLLIEKLAITDGLTGLYNHRHFRECLAKELKRAKRYEHKLSLIMLDIDNFKYYNDRYGHSQGDIILREIGELLQLHCRNTDCIARYGGEEFAIILPLTPIEMAATIAERLRSSIAEHIFDLEVKHTVKITVSLGVGCYPLHATTNEALINAADMALYAAKSKKNCVRIFDEVI